MAAVGSREIRYHGIELDENALTLWRDSGEGSGL